VSAAERIYKWTEPRRKAAASGIAGTAVTVYAIWTRAPFAEFANAVEWILGIYLTGHAASDAMTTFKPKPGAALLSKTPPPLPGKP
jgi:hypothetical protein